MQAVRPGGDGQRRGWLLARRSTGAVRRLWAIVPPQRYDRSPDACVAYRRARETLPFYILQKGETIGVLTHTGSRTHWSHAASFPLSHHARTSGLVSGLVGRRRCARGRVAKQDVGGLLGNREDGRPELPAWHRGLGLGLGARL